MAKDPAILFYTTDFLAGTLLMKNEEIGAYIRLLCLQREQGHLTLDDINAICGVDMPRVRAKFKIDENGLYYNERMDLEISKRQRYIKAQTVNGQKGGRPPKEKTHGFNLGLAKENPLGNRNININDNSILESNTSLGEEKRGVGEEEDANAVASFSAFWAAYPKKRNKQDAFEAFAKLAPDDALLGVILGAIEDQKTWEDWNRDKGKYIPLPSTWLNNRRWEDEPTEIVTEKPKARYGTFDPVEAMERAIARSFKKEIHDEH